MSITKENAVPEGVEKELEPQNKMMEPLQPLLEQHNKIEENTSEINIESPHKCKENTIHCIKSLRFGVYYL